MFSLTLLVPAGSGGFRVGFLRCCSLSNIHHIGLRGCTLKISRHDFLLGVVLLIWGFNFGFVKEALQEFEPLAFNVVRLLLGMPALLLMVYQNEKRIVLDNGRLVRNSRDYLIFAGLSLFLAGDNIFYVWGLARTSSANASILYTLSPIVVAVFAVLGGTGLSRLCILGLVIAFWGCATVISGSLNPVMAFVVRGSPAGDLVVLLGVVCWAGFTHFSPHVLDRYSPVRVTAYASIGAAALSLILCFKTLFAQSWASVSWLGWSGLVYSALLSNVLCLAIWYYAISKIGPLKVISVEYLLPVTAIGMAFFIWGEPVYYSHIMGAVLVLAGVRLVRSS